MSTSQDDNESAPSLPTASTTTSAKDSNSDHHNSEEDNDDEFADIAPFLPKIEIKKGSDGLPIAPASMASEGGLAKRLPPSRVAGIITRRLDIFVKSFRQQVSGKSPDEVKVDKQEAKKIAEMIAYRNALATKEERREAAEKTAAATKRYKKAQEEFAKLKGDTHQEKMGRWVRKGQKEFQKKSPFAEAYTKRYQEITQMCLDYGPPAYSTSVLKDSTPLLRHFIENYLDGVDGFTRDLQGGGCLRYMNEELCAEFRKLVDEVSDPVRNRGKPWTKIRRTVLLVATYLASADPRRYSHLMSPAKRQLYNFAAHIDDNFNATRAIIRTHTEAICAELLGMENEMRASGDYAKLEALVLPEPARASVSSDTNTANSESSATSEIEQETTVTTSAAPVRSEGALRQDRADMLGAHPEFVKLEKTWRRKPIGYPSHTKEQERLHMIYLWTDPPELLECVDNDMSEMIRGYLKQMDGVHKAFLRNPLATRAQVEAARILESCPVQPYILWLLRIARQVAPHFAKRMYKCFSDSEFDYSEAGVKGFLRCDEKVKEK